MHRCEMDRIRLRNDYDTMPKLKTLNDNSFLRNPIPQRSHSQWYAAPPYLRSRQRPFMTLHDSKSIFLEFSRTTGAKDSSSSHACFSQAGRLGLDRCIQCLGRPPVCAGHDVPEHLDPVDVHAGRLSPSGAFHHGLSIPQHGNRACGFALARRRILGSRLFAGVRPAVDRAAFSVTTSAVTNRPVSDNGLGVGTTNVSGCCRSAVLFDFSPGRDGAPQRCGLERESR